MKSKLVGESTSQVEALNISKHGLWLLVHGREHFLPFEHFLWFKNASIYSILNVELPQPHHLYLAEFRCGFRDRIYRIT